MLHARERGRLFLVEFMFSIDERERRKSKIGFLPHRKSKYETRLTSREALARWRQTSGSLRTREWLLFFLCDAEHEKYGIEGGQDGAIEAALSWLFVQDRSTLNFFLSFFRPSLPSLFFSRSLIPLTSKKTKNSLELVPRASVLSAHARERSLGLGDGDIEAYKAFVVECAFFGYWFFLFFFHPPPPLSLFLPLSSPFLSFLSFSLLILQTWPRSRDTPRGPSANAWCPRPPSSPAGTFIGGAFRACPPCRWRSRASSWPRKSRSRTSRRGTF